MGTDARTRPDSTAESSRPRRLARAFLAATLAVHATLAAAVYIDARDRDPSGPAWAAATLATGLVGVVGYLRRR
ncbi:hypothetical protein [Candidatus Halobonum tyrrellensis]|uniref:Uncharacterized protein n=1 Tax=Candidatus Halobonum tyrrellensis G22 TaxID=1324957 RepID=V4GQL9_9EURY|nr:hypothetical protein [Candidatus Halobonum tyrrellensis]ESP87321.1 hypothetical protein K933_14583 [Candidatus Halobonum tyrrellensis G22]